MSEMEIGGPAQPAKESQDRQYAYARVMDRQPKGMLAYSKDRQMRQPYFDGYDLEDAFDEGANHTIELTCEWIRRHIDVDEPVETNENGEPLADSYVERLTSKEMAANEAIELYKQFMKEKDK
jgi:hypothetical protein